MRARAGAVLTQSTAATHDVSDMLRHYPSGMLSTPLDVRCATLRLSVRQRHERLCRGARRDRRRSLASRAERSPTS